MLLMASVYEEAGFPAGVVNVVTGSGAEVGNYLVESDQVDMVSMTGGTATGRGDHHPFRQAGQGHCPGAGRQEPQHLL